MTDALPPGETWFDVLSHQKSYAVLFCAAAAATYLAAPTYIRIAIRRGWVNRPGGRKTHDQPTATMGGLIVLAAVFIGAVAVLCWHNRVGAMLREHMTPVIGALACTAAAATLGAIDDRRGVRVKVKLLAQFAIAIAAYLLGFRIEAVTLPWLGSTPLGGVSFLLSMIWIVGIMNAVNFTDGMDGLAAGVCFLAAGINAGVAIWLGNYYMAVMMLLLAGALLGFLRWNFHPARLFLGDAGSLGVGTFLALCSLHSAQKSHTAVMILVPLCALGYPIFDLLLAVARRTARGQPMWASDRDHIHHRLLARGHSVSQTAGLIYVASFVLVLACIVAMTANHLAIGLALAAVLALAIFSVRVLGYMEWGGWRERGETKVLHAAAHLARLKISSAQTPSELLAAFAVFAAETSAAKLTLETTNNQLSWLRDGAVISGTDALAIEIPGVGTLTVYPADIGDARTMFDDLARSAARTSGL